MSSLLPTPIPAPITLRKLNGRHQLIIDSELALRQVAQLDPMYWSANSAPTAGLSCNQQFLCYLDADNNQRIMPAEIILACEWMNNWKTAFKAKQRSNWRTFGKITPKDNN